MSCEVYHTALEVLQSHPAALYMAIPDHASSLESVWAIHVASLTPNEIPSDLSGAQLAR